MMTWGLPTDCSGNPEADVAFYSVYLLAIWVIGWYECAPGVMCPIYAYSDWMPLGTTAEMFWGPLPDPPVGGIDIYDVKATDHAGNQSQDCP